MVLLTPPLPAVAAVIVHAFLRRHFGPYFDPFFIIVVGFSTWYAGFGAGLATLAPAETGALLSSIHAAGALRLLGRTDALELTGYGISGLLMSMLIAVLLASRRRAERTTARTARLHALNASLAPALSSGEDAAIVLPHAMQSLQARAGAVSSWLPGARDSGCSSCPGTPMTT